MKFRAELRASDVEAIRTLVKETGVFNDEEIAVAVELAEETLEASEPHYHFLFAEENGQMLGYTCFGRIPFTDARYDLYWIATSKRGVSGSLISETEKTVKALGGKAIYADTSSRTIYAPAHQFYVRTGYAEVARLKDYYKDGDDKLTFSKFL